jgi:tRNA-dihydrouridine synthase B
VLAGGEAPQGREIADIAAEHYRTMLEFYGEGVAVRHARKHLGWYLERFAPAIAAADKAAIMTARDPAEVSQRFYDALTAAASDNETREAA